VDRAVEVDPVDHLQSQHELVDAVRSDLRRGLRRFDASLAQPGFK
jgi:hypothetical protein